MNNIKIENWNGHEIRFVLHNGEWWAVLKDVCNALTLSNPTVVASRIDEEERSKFNLGRQGEVVIVNEFGIYQSIFQSRKKEAKDFQKWTFGIIKALRQATALEGFQIFRMLDKEHQKEAMSRLNDSLKSPARVDFIKANTIANKAVSSLYGYDKMVKKDSMTPDMLVKRQEILDNTTDLMAINDKLQMDISVSKIVYNKYSKDKALLA
jgi:prophage antirepressor-like protein